MSSIRLLVLGVVKFAQPVHGYDVRKELQGWRLEGYVNMQTGSIYSALKTLERDGCIAVADHLTTRGRPERTEYMLTIEGDKQFHALLRSSWWHVEQGTEPLIPALSFMGFMPRAELIAALQARLSQIEAQVSELRFVRNSIRDGATGADGDIPEHVREVLDFSTSRLKSDIEWTKQFIKRLRDGTYILADER